jgi:predicted ABC-type ATPase
MEKLRGATESVAHNAAGHMLTDVHYLAPATWASLLPIELIFLKLPSIRLALARVQARVAQGGHPIAAAVVRRRFKLGWRNFEQLYRPLVDHWELYDNSGDAPVLLAEGGKA